jgi:hypothetical protein
MEQNESMNAITQLLLLGFAFLLASLFFGGLLRLNHESCQFGDPSSRPSRSSVENDIEEYFARDREFVELGTEKVGTVAPRGPSGPALRPSRPSVEFPSTAGSPFRPIDPPPTGRIEIICANCKKLSARLHALPDGNVVCPTCHESLVLNAVFTPLE